MKFDKLSRKWLIKSAEEMYSYGFTWLDRPIIQYPQDIVAMQEIIYRVKPDLIIETGIAYGGGLVFYASLLELMGHGAVLGIEKCLYNENREALMKHPLFHRIGILEGSSVSYSIIEKVYEIAHGKKVLMVLDSAHTHDHVLRELDAYSPLVERGSYIVVCDTVIEDLPDRLWKGKPYGRGDNPATAVREFLRNNNRFEVDRNMDRLAISVAPGGYLKCLK